MAKMELKDFIIYKFCIGKQMTKTVFILVESEEHNILKKEKKKKEIETEIFHARDNARLLDTRQYARRDIRKDR